MLDRVLVLRSEAITKTASGIVIPEKAQAKVLQATVVAVGPGSRNQVFYDNKTVGFDSNFENNRMDNMFPLEFSLAILFSYLNTAVQRLSWMIKKNIICSERQTFWPKFNRNLV